MYVRDRSSARLHREWDSAGLAPRSFPVTHTLPFAQVEGYPRCYSTIAMGTAEYAYSEITEAVGLIVGGVG